MLLRKRRPETDFSDLGDEQADTDEYIPSEFTDWCCLPEEELLSSESRRHLDLAIQDLPAKLRIVFILRDIEGLSIHETAEALDLSETAVKTRLLRARLRLREQLGRYFSERISGRRNEK